MVGELTLRIVHCLIADERASIDAIKIIRSHPQAFAQCKDFLDKYPDWTLEPCNNTAVAVASIAREGAVKVAAIASESAARANGLKILKEGIETNPLNYTRFAIISRRVGEKSPAAPVPPSLGTERANKASLVFSVSDEHNIISFKYKWTTSYEVKPYLEKDRFPLVFWLSAGTLGAIGIGVLTYFLLPKKEEVVDTTLSTSDLPSRRPSGVRGRAR
jgi:hypothetical protein